jgi:hypothetical protein
MMQFAAIFANDRYVNRFKRMQEYTSKYKSDDLRIMFDNFMAKGGDRLDRQAANCFFNAVVEWSGA